MLRTVSVLLVCVAIAGSALYLTSQPRKGAETVSNESRAIEQRFTGIEEASEVSVARDSIVSQDDTSTETNAVAVFDEEIFQDSHDSLMQIVEAYDANLTDHRERQLLEQKFAEQSDAYKQQVLAQVKSQN